MSTNLNLNGINELDVTVTGGTSSASTSAGKTSLVLTPSGSGSSVVRAMAFSSGGQSITGSFATNIIQLDTIVSDPSGYINTSTYKVTPTISGYYQAFAQVSIIAAFAGYVAIYKNGVQALRGVDFGVTDALGLTVSGMVQCNGSTDYLQLVVINRNAGAGTTATPVGSELNYLHVLGPF